MEGEPRSHPSRALSPVHAGVLSSVGGNRVESLSLKNCTKSQLTFSTALSLRMVVTWGVASACPCVHEQVVKKIEAAEGDRASNWILGRFGPRSMLSFSSESHVLSSLVFSPPPAFSFGCCFTMCSSVVSSHLRRTTFYLMWGSRV